MERIAGLIDEINRYIGWAMAFLVPALVLELVYDTVARYMFNSPTEWSFDITYMLYAAIFTLSAPHALKMDKHVRIETIYGKLSERNKALMDAVGYLIFFFPAVTALVYYGWLFFLRSYRMGEVGGESMWQPPIYPFKALIPIAAALLLLQGLAQFYRCALTVWSGGNIDPEP
jgi:TRAP-type mannitol/chloroaromatic compound transport system permease small subunit